MTKVAVGDQAPDFTLPDHRGDQVTLSGFIGESNVVLYFYPKDFSPGCTAQACFFRDNYEDFTDMGAVVIGVSGGLLPGRVTYIIDKKGVVRHVFTSEINMRKHVDEALRILRKLSEES
jgi:peroxiredoxin Q/BCP